MAAVEHARKLAAAGPPNADYVARLGEGWVAEEAVAIAIYCALAASDFDEGVRLAVNHDGDSDSTGAIAGNLLGAIHGIEAIPTRLTNGLELIEVVVALADDLATFPHGRSASSSRRPTRRRGGSSDTRPIDLRGSGFSRTWRLRGEPNVRDRAGSGSAGMRPCRRAEARPTPQDVVPFWAGDPFCSAHNVPICHSGDGLSRNAAHKL